MQLQNSQNIFLNRLLTSLRPSLFSSLSFCIFSCTPFIVSYFLSLSLLLFYAFLLLPSSLPHFASSVQVPSVFARSPTDVVPSSALLVDTLSCLPCMCNGFHVYCYQLPE